MSEAACRADVWLWRARFFKTRTLAAKVAHVKYLGSYPVAGLDGPARRTAATKAWRDADTWMANLRVQVREA